MPEMKSRYARPCSSNRRVPDPRSKTTGRRLYVCRMWRDSRAFTSVVVVVIVPPSGISNFGLRGAKVLQHEHRAGGFVHAVLRVEGAAVNDPDARHAFEQ